MLEARAASAALVATAPLASWTARWRPEIPGAWFAAPEGATDEAAGWPPHEATAIVTTRRENDETVLDITRVIGTPAGRH